MGFNSGFKGLRIFKTKYIWLAFLFKVIIMMYGTMNLKLHLVFVQYATYIAVFKMSVMAGAISL